MLFRSVEKSTHTPTVVGSKKAARKQSSVVNRQKRQFRGDDVQGFDEDGNVVYKARLQPRSNKRVAKKKVVDG